MRRIDLNGTNYPDVIAAAQHIYNHTLIYGGGTFDAVSGAPVEDQTGYAVGGYQDTRTVPYRECSDEVVVDVIASFLQRIPGKLGGGKHYFLGTWIEGDLLFIDAVKIIDDRDTAVQAAEDHNEIAIYHLGTGTTLYGEHGWEDQGSEDDQGGGGDEPRLGDLVFDAINARAQGAREVIATLERAGVVPQLARERLRAFEDVRGDILDIFLTIGEGHPDNDD